MSSSIEGAKAVHAARHHTGGADPLAPADIGAVATSADLSTINTPTGLALANTAQARSRVSTGPGTDWFSLSRYGIFTHYAWGGTANPETIYADGSTPTSLDQLADDFNAEQFAADIASFGAQYLIFTAYHFAMYALYPSAVMNATLTGHASTRDVIADLITALKPYGIRLVLYIHATDGGDLQPAEQTATGWNDSTNNYATWNTFITNLVAEMGNRYGTDLDGFWVDGVRGTPFYSRFVDAQAFRAALLTGNSGRIIIGNNGNDDSALYLLGSGLPVIFDVMMREYDSSLPASINDYTSAAGSSALLASTQWWATVASSAASPAKYSASDMFRFTSLCAGTNTRGGGVAWGAGCYAGSPPSLWEPGVAATLTALAGKISALGAAYREVIPSNAYNTTPGATLNSLSAGFVATTGAAGTSAYVHVLTAPAAGAALDVAAPAANLRLSSATNLATGNPALISASPGGGYSIVLAGGDEWASDCTVLEVRQNPTTSADKLWLPATVWTTSNTAVLQPAGGGSRFPVWQLQHGVSQQIECSFMVPDHWLMFDAIMYFTALQSGTGNVSLVSNLLEAAPGASLTVGDQTGLTGSRPFAVPAQNVLSTVLTFAEIVNVPSAAMHMRLSRFGTGASDTATVDIGVLGVMILRRL